MVRGGAPPPGYSLIVTAKLNDVAPQSPLSDVLRPINDHPVSDPNGSGHAAARQPFVIVTVK
jgi:hypothetical protein